MHATRHIYLLYTFAIRKKWSCRIRLCLRILRRGDGRDRSEMNELLLCRWRFVWRNCYNSRALILEILKRSSSFLFPFLRFCHTQCWGLSKAAQNALSCPLKYEHWDGRKEEWLEMTFVERSWWCALDTQVFLFFWTFVWESDWWSWCSSDLYAAQSKREWPNRDLRVESSKSQDLRTFKQMKSEFSLDLLSNDWFFSSKSPHHFSLSRLDSL